MKYVLVAACSLLLGYFLYPSLNQDSPLEAETKTKFEAFVNNEVRNYAELKDAEAKLKAAEEMYGKMMLLFLAEMGIRSKQELKKVEATPETVVTHAEVKTTPGPEHVTAVAAPTVRPEVVLPKETKLKDTPKEAWTKYATTPFLESIKGKDKRLIGQFEGALTHSSGKNAGRVDTVVMEFNLTQTVKGISGNTLVLMIDPTGKEYSRNAGNGGNRALKGSELPDAYYVEASPNTYFMINLKRIPEVRGQYFEKGKFVGNVVLRKTF